MQAANRRLQLELQLADWHYPPNQVADVLRFLEEQSAIPSSASINFLRKDQPDGCGSSTYAVKLKWLYVPDPSSPFCSIVRSTQFTLRPPRGGAAASHHPALPPQPAPLSRPQLPPPPPLQQCMQSELPPSPSASLLSSLPSPPPPLAVLAGPMSFSSPPPPAPLPPPDLLSASSSPRGAPRQSCATGSMGFLAPQLHHDGPSHVQYQPIATVPPAAAAAPFFSDASPAAHPSISQQLWGPSSSAAMPRAASSQPDNDELPLESESEGWVAQLLGGTKTPVPPVPPASKPWGAPASSSNDPRQASVAVANGGGWLSDQQDVLMSGWPPHLSHPQDNQRDNTDWPAQCSVSSTTTSYTHNAQGHALVADTSSMSSHHPLHHVHPPAERLPAQTAYPVSSCSYYPGVNFTCSYETPFVSISHLPADGDGPLHAFGVPSQPQPHRTAGHSKNFQNGSTSSAAAAAAAAVMQMKHHAAGAAAVEANAVTTQTDDPQSPQRVFAACQTENGDVTFASSQTEASGGQLVVASSQTEGVTAVDAAAGGTPVGTAAAESQTEDSAVVLDPGYDSWRAEMEAMVPAYPAASDPRRAPLGRMFTASSANGGGGLLPGAAGAADGGGAVGCELVVLNLPYTASAQQVHDHFAQCGRVTQVRMPESLQQTGQNRGYAFVQFSEAAAAQEALTTLDGTLLMGSSEARSTKRLSVQVPGSGSKGSGAHDDVVGSSAGSGSSGGGAPMIRLLKHPDGAGAQVHTTAPAVASSFGYGRVDFGRADLELVPGGTGGTLVGHKGHGRSRLRRSGDGGTVGSGARATAMAPGPSADRW